MELFCAFLLAQFKTHVMRNNLQTIHASRQSRSSQIHFSQLDANSDYVSLFYNFSFFLSFFACIIRKVSSVFWICSGWKEKCRTGKNLIFGCNALNISKIVYNNNIFLQIGFCSDKTMEIRNYFEGTWSNTAENKIFYCMAFFFSLVHHYV